MLTNSQIKIARNVVLKRRYRSTWDKGIQTLAVEMLEKLMAVGKPFTSVDAMTEFLLEGADSWKEYTGDLRRDDTEMVKLLVHRRKPAPEDVKKLADKALGKAWHVVAKNALVITFRMNMPQLMFYLKNQP